MVYIPGSIEASVLGAANGTQKAESLFGGLWSDLKQAGSTVLKYTTGQLYTSVSGQLKDWSNDLDDKARHAISEADKSALDYRKSLGFADTNSTLVIIGAVLLAVILLRGKK